MTLLMRDQENFEQGLKQGIKQGIEEGEALLIALLRKLTEEKRFDDITKIQENENYRQELYKEYHIID